MRHGPRLWRFAFAGCGMAEAEAFQNALIDAFCSMPESAGVGAGCGVRFEPDYGEREGGPFTPVELDDL